ASPDQCTNVGVQVQDASGLGVDNQTVLLTTDKGAIAQGFNVAPGFTRKTITATSASVAQSPGGEIKAGTIQVTWCALQTDTPGNATLTAQNVSTPVGNATATE